jgi:hypothetical protein
VVKPNLICQFFVADVRLPILYELTIFRLRLVPPDLEQMAEFPELFSFDVG